MLQHYIGYLYIMSRRNISYMLFFIYNIVGSSVYAGGGVCGLFSCKPECVESDLLALGLPPIITENEELLSRLELEHGSQLVSKLIEKHPLLAKKSREKIDVSTLKWVKNEGFSKTFSPGVKYIFSPFLSAENNFGSNALIDTFLPETYPFLRSRLGFFNEEQLNAAKQEFKKENFRTPVHFLGRSFDITGEKALKIAKKIYSTVFKEGNYILADNLSNISGHYIMIVGYGLPGADFVSDNRVSVTYKDVINILKENKIPNDVNVELKHDYAGFGKVDTNTKKTENQLTKMFVKRSLEIIQGSKEDSYAYKFAKGIYSAWPQFTGDIIAYNGLILPEKGGYMRDPENLSTVTFEQIGSVGLLDINNTTVAFDKIEMTVEYKKENFAIN